ncbi:hypothetical protein D3C84_962390 [compost metagenome]
MKNKETVKTPEMVTSIHSHRDKLFLSSRYNAKIVPACPGSSYIKLYLYKDDTSRQLLSKQVNTRSSPSKSFAICKDQISG